MAQLPIGSGWHLKRARLIAATLALMQNFAGHGEAQMKGTAPWADRTALARGGLQGEAFSKVMAAAWRLGFTLRHTMQYGKWLETVNGAAMGGRAGMTPTQLMSPTNVGNFAVIHPTAQSLFPRVKIEVRRLWST